MTGIAARNRPLYEQGQAARGEIRTILMAHSPLDMPLTAKTIQRRLTRQLSARTIQWHLRAIRTGH